MRFHGLVLVVINAFVPKCTAQLGTTACEHCIPVDMSLTRPSNDNRHMELLSTGVSDATTFVNLEDHSLPAFEFLGGSYKTIHVKDNGYLSFDNSASPDNLAVMYRRIPIGEAFSSYLPGKPSVIGYYSDFDLRGPEEITYNDNGQLKQVTVNGRVFVDVCVSVADCSQVTTKLQQHVEAKDYDYFTSRAPTDAGGSADTDTISYAVTITWYKVPTTRLLNLLRVDNPSVNGISLATFQISLLRTELGRFDIVFNYDKSVTTGISDLDDCRKIPAQMASCNLESPFKLYSFGPALDTGDGYNMLELLDRNRNWLWYLGHNNPRIHLKDVNSDKDHRTSQGNGTWLDNECASSPCGGGVCIDRPYKYECKCAENTSGVNCERDFNACVDQSTGPHDCKFGTCNHINRFTYSCDCDLGFQGATCDKSYLPCDSAPCTNGATCEEHVDIPASEFNYYCRCKPGFAGTDCERPANICDSTDLPCGNFGTCIPHQDSPHHFTCNCDDGYHGQYCGKIDLCRAKPCLNQGNCTYVLHEEDFTCSCLNGFNGNMCQFDVDECESAPCFHPKICVDYVGSYECKCPGHDQDRHFTGNWCTECEVGWQGANCDQNIDDCASVPCQRGGTCVDNVGSFTCVCPAGYTGKQCVQDLDECLSQEPICENSALCQNQVGSFECLCTTGWTGEKCDVDLDECGVINHPCLATMNQQNQCLNTPGAYQCVCANPEFQGPYCNVDVNECDEADLCQNGGTCINQSPGFHCQCSIEYTSTFCDKPNPCISSPCINLGKCIVHGSAEDEFKCMCDAARWTGALCQWAVCPCVNGACVSETIRNAQDHHCHCDTKWTGDICDTEINGCNSQPCLGPNSECIVDADDVFMYSCKCGVAETGKMCEIEINPCLSMPCDQGYKCQSSEYSLDYMCECASLFCSPFYYVMLAALLVVPAVITGVVITKRIERAENEKRRRKGKGKRKRSPKKSSEKKPPAPEKKTPAVGMAAIAKMKAMPRRLSVLTKDNL